MALHYHFHKQFHRACGYCIFQKEHILFVSMCYVFIVSLLSVDPMEKYTAFLIFKICINKRKVLTVHYLELIRFYRLYLDLIH